MPFAPSSFLFLVVRPGAPSSFLLLLVLLLVRHLLLEAMHLFLVASDRSLSSHVPWNFLHFACRVGIT